MFAVIGFAILLGTPITATKTRYGGVFLATMGIYTPGPIVSCRLRRSLCLSFVELTQLFQWLSFGMANAGMDQMRAVAAGLLVGLGTMGSIGKC
jgi:hypothetical protein